MRKLALVIVLAGVWNAASAGTPPSAGERVSVVLPDFGAELRAFEAPEKNPVKWWPYIINAGWGGGRGGPERKGGWLDKNWELLDYIDRSGDYTTHGYLTHRGIWYEVYGSNEYQETIHFIEAGARKLLWDNGIAQDMNGERVLSADYNMKVDWWAKKIGWEAYITCNNAPRWWSIINYDWLTSPLLGFAMSQDNIGGPTSRIGAGGHGRYCDFCNARFMHYLEGTNRLPEFRQKYKHIRDYVQANLMDVVEQLPPHVKHRFDEAEAQLLGKMCAPPVMSEYQKFLYLSHLHNFMRYYQDAKLSAQRIGRDYDVHGNQGGSFIGTNPYQVALMDFVDTIWFESSGISTYDIFKYHWNNAWGSFRYEICRAMSRGRKPVMCMSGFHKNTPDLVEHEMAEQCAGGGVLFVNQTAFEKELDLEQKVTEYFRFRHEHRALFADQGKERYAQIALVYSIPTMMYHDYMHSAAAAPTSALSGMARALEEGHLPFDVVIFNHPEIHADPVTLDDLKRYRLVVLPALECLTDSQIELLTNYLQSGGALGIIGQCGVRNEDNLPREHPPVEVWRKAGKVVDILPGRDFLPSRVVESAQTRELTRLAIESTRKALDNKTLLSGDLPRMLWVKTWQHGDEFISLHFVNYDVDFETGKARPTPAVKLTIALPAHMTGEEAAWLTPDGKQEPVSVAVEGDRASVTIPPVRVYGVLLLGRKGLDVTRSAILKGEALLARAAMAAGGNLAKSPQQAPADILHSVQQAQDKAYLQGVRDSVLMEAATLFFDFGGKTAQPPWKLVAADSNYSGDAGFGWLPAEDDSSPTPEEIYYAGAQKYGNKIATEITASRLLFWPYKEPPPTPLATNIGCGTSRRFRVDLPTGAYTVRIVTTNPSWTHRNFLVSGMMSVNGAVRLLDAVQDRGALLPRQFSVSTPEGKLEFTFGGPTGWAVAAMMIRPEGKRDEDPQVTGGLRTWRVSPRYSNPDWYPITQVVGPPEKRLTSLPESNWLGVNAPSDGLPVTDLGTNREAEVGDVVYAVTTIQSPAARAAFLRFSASSQAQLWLNGAALGYVPNEKGIRRDEFVAPLDLRAGENKLVVKLQRFWERRWLFYASVTDQR